MPMFPVEENFKAYNQLKTRYKENYFLEAKQGKLLTKTQEVAGSALIY